MVDGDHGFGELLRRNSWNGMRTATWTRPHAVEGTYDFTEWMECEVALVSILDLMVNRWSSTGFRTDIVADSHFSISSISGVNGPSTPNSSATCDRYPLQIEANVWIFELDVFMDDEGE